MRYVKRKGRAKPITEKKIRKNANPLKTAMTRGLYNSLKGGIK